MNNDEYTDILFKFPTRGRPDKFRNQFDKYYNMLSGQLKVRFVALQSSLSSRVFL